MNRIACSLAGLLLLSSCQSGEENKVVSQQSAKQSVAEQGQERATNDTLSNDSETRSADFSMLNTLMNSRGDAPQTFTVAAETSRWVKGKKGIRVYVRPEDLETEDGRAPSGSIDVSLLEMTSVADFVRNNAPTVSDGKQLFSGGSCILTCRAGGKPLRIKNGRTMQIAFPATTTNGMQAFYGRRDADGVMNWTADKATVRTPSGDDSVWVEVPRTVYKDSLIKRLEMNERTSINKNKVAEGHHSSGVEFDTVANKAYFAVYDKVYVGTSIDMVRIHKRTIINRDIYNLLRVRNLGAINCDAFNRQVEGSIVVTAPEGYDMMPLVVISIFPDRNAVRQQNIFFERSKKANSVVTIPGLRTRFVCFGFANGQLLGSVHEIMTGTAKVAHMNLHPITKADMEAMIAGTSS